MDTFAIIKENFYTLLSETNKSRLQEIIMDTKLLTINKLDINLTL